jgi:type IV pilus assembly protein PilV
MKPIRGFTLVEVLIALVILSVGMLGIAALLLNSLQGSRTALLRTQAVTLAADMAERIRSNRAGGTVYDTRNTPTPALQPTCETAGSTCTAAQMAQNDLKRWQDAIQSTLPVDTTVAGSGGTVLVQPITPVVNRYTITVGWTQSGDNNLATFSVTVDI